MVILFILVDFLFDGFMITLFEISYLIFQCSTFALTRSIVFFFCIFIDANRFKWLAGVQISLKPGVPKNKCVIWYEVKHHLKFTAHELFSLNEVSNDFNVLRYLKYMIVNLMNKRLIDSSKYLILWKQSINQKLFLLSEFKMC